MSGLPLLLLLPALPIVLAGLSSLPFARPVARLGSPIPPLLAVGVAVFTPDLPPTPIPWAPGAAGVSLDDTGRVFLALTAVVWLFAAAYALLDRARPLSDRTWVLALLAMGGNLAVPVAADPVSFFSAFALMAIPLYGMIVTGVPQPATTATPTASGAYTGDRDLSEQGRAGRVYIAYTILSEAFLLGAVMMTAAIAGSVPFEHAADALAASPLRGLVAALALAGLGVKVGLPPLHGWMPLSYAAAPAPMAAAIAGATSKAGVLGLLRFVMPATAGSASWAGVVIAVGLSGAFLGAVLGVMQRGPKEVLAYSSVSQLGLITTGVGVASLSDHPAEAVSAVALYSLHHALAKAALFLGEDVAGGGRGRRWAILGLALPSAALVGLPFTGGALSKLALKHAAEAVPPALHDPLVVALNIAAVGTTLLLARFLWLVAVAPARRRPVSRGPTAVWVASLLGVSAAAWLAPGDAAEYARGASVSLGSLWPAAWPAVLGSALAFAAWATWRAGLLRAPRLPAGDAVVAFELGASALLGVLVVPGEAVPPQPQPAGAPSTWARALAATEERMTRWAVAGAIFVGVALAMVALAVLAR